MRRIIHNSTAIAACLSLLAPHVALAQAPAIPETQQEPAATDPAQAAPATEAGGEPAEASCEDGTAPPCADAAAPEAEPVTEEPAAETAEPAAEAPASDPQAETAPQPGAEAQAEPEMQDAATEPQAQPDTPSGEAEPEPEAAAEPAAETDTQAPAEADAAMDEDALADALAEDAAAQEQPQQEAAQAEAPDAEADPAMTGSADAEADAAEAQASRVEADAAATDDAAPADQAAESDANAEAETEVEAATEADSDAQPADPQPQTQSQEAAGQPRAPEEGVAETEAAREAAEASETPAAAALSDETGDADLREEQITEENSRSSDEDFATSLRDALGAATGQPQPAAEAEGGDDDDNDLTRALLLGLGGLAVGAMLTNNRQVALSAPDRVVVTRPDGSQQVIKDEVALLRQPGSTVTTEDFDDGSSRTIVTRADGSKVVTIRDADLRVLRRTLVSADGSSIPLIDDTADVQPVDIAGLPAPADLSSAAATGMDEDALRAALLRESSFDRRFTLAQIRNIPQVRALVAPVNIDAITFDTGSAAISPDQARSLSSLGKVIRDAVASNPREIFLIEGHTDTVGSDPANLALSDRRAESVALALTEYFDVPPENMVVQGYGEQFLAVRSEGDIRENRRASVRRISDLLQTAAR